MEDNELNVFAETHCTENDKDDSLNDNIPRNNKSGFRHFVEESTLRNVSLDGLDELSEVGCSTSEGNNRRSPSSVSSEPPIMRRGFIVEPNEEFPDSGEFFTRVLFMLFLLGSFGTICNSGTETTDVFDYPMASVIRVHIFALILGLLFNLSFIIMNMSSLIDSFPPVMYKYDAIINSIVFIVLFITGILLLHTGYNHFHVKSPSYMTDSEVEWAFAHIIASGILGILSSGDALLLAICLGCKGSHQTNMAMTDEIALTSLQSS